MWLTAYVFGFGLLQVMIYRYFSTQTPAPESAEGPIARADGGQQVITNATDTIPCGHCGAVNESHRMIRYCGACAESLR